MSSTTEPLKVCHTGFVIGNPSRITGQVVPGKILKLYSMRYIYKRKQVL